MGVGAGSEGGSGRFMTGAPSLDDMRLYGKASAASTKKGAASWSAGASIPAPLVNDRVGISLSAFTKKDGGWLDRVPLEGGGVAAGKDVNRRSEEHTSELQSLMRNSYAVFCLKQNTSKL